ncbi:MAG: hypothetical protein RLW61_09200 [Gammaproteobacteria bacterium]
MRCFVRSALALAFTALAATPIQAAVVAAESGVTTHSPCPSFCGGSGSQFASDFGGGEGFDYSYSAIANGDGNARAEAAVSGPGIPQISLRVEAFSSANSRASANASAMRKYLYSGPTSNIVLSIGLDGALVDGSQPPDAYLRANVMAVVARDLDFYGDYGTFAYEIIPGTPDANIVDEVELDFYRLGLVGLGTQTVNSQLAFTLEDGDSLYLWASLVGYGTRGGSADAFNTLGMAFTEGNLAGIAAAPVPLPAPLVLLGSALLAGLTRRRRALSRA